MKRTRKEIAASISYYRKDSKEIEYANVILQYSKKSDLEQYVKNEFLKNNEKFVVLEVTNIEIKETTYTLDESKFFELAEPIKTNIVKEI